jgi:hypothetical protein
MSTVKNVSTLSLTVPLFFCKQTRNSLLISVRRGRHRETTIFSIFYYGWDSKETLPSSAYLIGLGHDNPFLLSRLNEKGKASSYILTKVEYKIIGSFLFRQASHLEGANNGIGVLDSCLWYSGATIVS